MARITDGVRLTRAPLQQRGARCRAGPPLAPTDWPPGLFPEPSPGWQGIAGLIPPTSPNSCFLTVVTRKGDATPRASDAAGYQMLASAISLGIREMPIGVWITTRETRPSAWCSGGTLRMRRRRRRVRRHRPSARSNAPREARRPLSLGHTWRRRRHEPLEMLSHSRSLKFPVRSLPPEVLAAREPSRARPLPAAVAGLPESAPSGASRGGREKASFRPGVGRGGRARGQGRNSPPRRASPDRAALAARQRKRPARPLPISKRRERMSWCGRRSPAKWMMGPEERRPRPVEPRKGRILRELSESRRRADSNRCTRLCRPLPNHSATSPGRTHRSPAATGTLAVGRSWRLAPACRPDMIRRRASGRRSARQQGGRVSWVVRVCA